jgi:hypothetical protein
MRTVMRECRDMDELLVEWYRYSPVELTMRCFSREPKTRRGAGLDLVLSGIGIEFSGDEPLTLPEAITSRPVASAASLQLADTHRLLAEHGVEMTRDHKQVLRRPLSEVVRLRFLVMPGYAELLGLVCSGGGACARCQSR